VSILQLVPSLLALLVDEPDLSRCTSLRRVFCGGETLSHELQERFFEQLGASLHNLYGPTEACIDALCWTCTRGSHERVIPIGRPIANTQAYVLDANLDAVPIGVAGELHIGGAGLARGYINRPDLSAERFLPHPFSDTPGARVYATGDRVRYRPDGNLEFLGRVDDQVKIRGVRIELQEIEAVLGRHPAVRQAAVVVREDVRGDRRLVAYYVGIDHLAVTADDLRTLLRDYLPETMVPSAFVRLDALPLRSNGKIDRQMLPAPSGRRPDLSEAFVSPRTDVEKAIAQIWSEVLQINPIGIQDDFFDLGGHSLLATQVMSRMNDAFGQKLPLRCLFESTTIAALATAVNGIGLQRERTTAVEPSR
jgi:acyl-coenzyme A synthetase/AMP-(fatty) acid ligase/acyl carrier protein